MQYFEYPLPGFKGYSAIENRDPREGASIANFWVRETSLEVREGCALQIPTVSASLQHISLLKTKAGDAYLVGAYGTAVVVANSGKTAWSTTSLTLASNNAYYDAVAFRDKLYLGNGSDRFSFDGATLTSIATDAPSFTCIDTWKNMLFCNKPSAPTYEFYSDPGVVTNLNVNYQSVAENDSDGVKGSVPLLNFLLLLNRYSAYAFYGSGDPFSKPKVASIGTVSRRSVANVNEVAYWLSDNGIYSYGGGTVRPISTDLGDIKDLINPSYAQYACAVGFRDYYFLACPTASGTTNDQLLAYDTLKNEWTHHTLPFSITQFLLDGEILYAAATNGGVYKMFGGATTDAGTAIEATWISDNLNLGKPGRMKKIKKIAIELADVSSGGTISIYLRQGEGSWSTTSYDVAVPTGDPGDTKVVAVETTRFYNLQIKLVTTARATINNITFSGKVGSKVK